MTCHRVALPGGGMAIVCTRERRRRCACGTAASLQCDWKVGGAKRNGEPKRCDAHICSRCAKEVAADKHLCPTHQVAYTQWRAQREVTA